MGVCRYRGVGGTDEENMVEDREVEIEADSGKGPKNKRAGRESEWELVNVGKRV